MKGRHINLVKKKNLSRNLKQKDKKLDISSSSLLRMFSVYWSGTPVKLAEGKRLVDIKQPPTQIP